MRFPARVKETLPCVGLDELFFPDKNSEQAYAEAVSVCADCRFVAECRELADEFEQGKNTPYGLFGVWGGETPTGRARRRARQRLNK